MSGWVSPQLQIRFEITADTLKIYRPNGERFLSFTELGQSRDQEHQRADRLADRLREIGVDPDER